MLRHLKLSHHTHSGRLRSHEHTSYLPLLFILACVGLTLGVYTVQAQTPGPEAGSIGLSGVMPGPPPTVAATINQPSNGQRFGTSPVTVSGTCPKGTLVEIFKNDIFAGSTVCGDNGRYSLEVDLLIGENRLVARVYDSLNQPGPDSNIVTVFYDALGTQGSPVTSLDFGSAQLLLNTDAVFRGVFPDREFTMPIEVLGGSPPYAINVQWGDSTNSVIPRDNNVSFNTAHTYKKPGTYQISLQGTDNGGRVAFLTVAAIVNGQPDPAAAATTASNNVNQLFVLWPLYTSALAVVVSFWLGERREIQVLRKRGQLLTT